MAASVQPDHNPYIRAFRQFVRNSVTCDFSQKEFVPLDLLEAYLDQRRVTQLLAALPGVIDAANVLEHYLRVFAILIIIGKAEYIKHFLQHSDLEDKILPITSLNHRPSHWPSVADSNDFFPSFYKAQWQFCALDFTQKLKGSVLDEDLILPIIEKKELGSGGSAAIYKIKLHDAYNHLVERAPNGRPLTDTFVLKTYFVSEAEKNYQNEVDAFIQLMSPRKFEENMIAFYGAYSQGGTYNIILEYADSGNLQEFFENVEPPSAEVDIINFWDNLFKIVQPLQRIHELKRGGNGPPSLQRVHQDIKAANVLVCKGTSESDYECTFKLADLGLSHLTGKDMCGTPMYSAPECCRSDRFMERTALEISPEIDIWSLGCLFSEAVVWVVRGMPGLKHYQNLRTIEIGELPGLTEAGYSGCFHNGTHVLKAVGHMHEDILEKRRMNIDHITEYVVPLIDNMLVDTNRFNAVHVHRNSQRILKKAREKKYPKIMQTVGSPVVPPRKPPYVPPEHAGLKLTHSYPSRSSRGLLSKQRRTGSELSGSSQLSYNGRSNPPNGASAFGRAVSWEHDSLDSESFEPSALSSRSTMRGTNLFASTIAQSTATLPSQKNGAPTEREHEYALDYKLRYRGVSRANTANGKTPIRDEGDGEYSPRLLSPARDNSRATAGNDGTIAEDLVRGKRPNLSVQEVHNWKKKKGRGSSPPLNGDKYLQRLNDRDHIFLIDDSASMKPYWPKLKRVFEALAWLVKRVDPDGLDLYFTSSPEKFHNKNTTPLASLVERREATLGGRCNIKNSLGNITQGYRAKIQSLDANRPRSRLSFLGATQKLHPISIYILTDGVWQDKPEPICGVDEPIRILVNELSNRGLLDGQAGIQFVRFGHDDIGMKRLRMIDNHKELKLDKDIVDTTSCDGNVLKMLLGAVDRDWDDDESGDEDDDDDNDDDNDDDDDTATHAQDKINGDGYGWPGTSSNT
ncbi:uncharacterized protein BDZ99DRAFT_473802 [Mytilinidion resinicola]|uniref:Protein kinase domain-containing protein n=1 Tax=Mytilinidion resinicola TaxID=574789 RepID=A0A6A6YWA6_9PEZI|nr:uncharacterized protein BDZ99DRAFT_473802 [Mytilinidion resinicola]KAF2813081.1 hypothetical protein BDZ99DRAFT_473802 [Mytilinidion resinicola]